MKAANEVRVGAVVLAALALLVFGYIYFRGVGIGAQMYYVRLQQPASISEGAEVRLQGVKIGVVHDVSLDPNTQKPLLVLAVNRHSPPYQLRKNYIYSVTSASLLGEHYVDIHGPVTADTDIYQPDDPDQIIVAKSSDLGTVKDELVDSLQETMNQLNVTLSRINNGVLSGENQKNLTIALQGMAQLSKQASKGVGPNGFKVALGDQKAADALRLTLQNSAAAANAINRTSELATQLLAQNRQRANAIFINLDKTSQETANVMESLNFMLKHSGIEQNAPQTFAALREAAENVKTATEGFKTLGNGDSVEGIRASLASLRESSDALRDATVSIKNLLTDTAMQGQFKSTFASLQQISSTLEKTSDNLNQASAGLKNVLGDAQLQEDLKASAEELRNTLANTSAAAARVNHLLGGRSSDSTEPKSTSTDATATKATSKSSSDNRRSGLDFTYRYLNNEENHHYGDLTFNTSLFGGPFRLGLSGIGDDNSLTLQTGNYLGDGGDIRYGLYRSKLGLGADYYWKRFSLEGNVYDPNNASWNAYLGLKLTPHVQVLLGRDKNGDVRSTALGVRLTR
jgi:ABC-type transporter Mla subunit MlaD